jgi:hypothetical protein
VVVLEDGVAQGRQLFIKLLTSVTDDKGAKSCFFTVTGGCRAVSPAGRGRRVFSGRRFPERQTACDRLDAVVRVEGNEAGRRRELAPGWVLDLPPYPWDCVALQFRRSIVLRPWVLSARSFFAVGVDSGDQGPHHSGWK